MQQKMCLPVVQFRPFLNPTSNLSLVDGCLKSHVDDIAQQFRSLDLLDIILFVIINDKVLGIQLHEALLNRLRYTM